MPQLLVVPASASRLIPAAVTQEVAAVLEAVDSQEAAGSQVAVVALAAVVGIDNKKS